MFNSPTRDTTLVNEVVVVRVGLLYDLANPPEWNREPAELYRYELEQAVRAEQLGIDGIWVTEHHFTHGYICSPLLFLTALATRTTAVRLGTAVLLPVLYHPVRLAEDIAILDVLSNGRVELGVGIGSVFQEYECFGVNPKERVSVLREILDILRLAWSGEEFSYHGNHFDLGPVTVIPKPSQQPHPPILGGAISMSWCQNASADGACRSSGSIEKSVRPTCPHLRNPGNPPSEPQSMATLTYSSVTIRVTHGMQSGICARYQFQPQHPLWIPRRGSCGERS